ncbi:MAG: hypothetical protein LBG88_00575 [Christensenellaceae bacterium]|jgi:deoxycytidylate deaminase|nr:hypothetical protein [Christensenellaceae bacterium]
MNLKESKLHTTLSRIENAGFISEDSPDTRCKVGCIIEGDGRILASGFNHAISDGVEWDATINKPNMPIKHAEMHALDKLSDFDVLPYKKLTAIVTKQPCYECLVDLVSAGVKTVYYRDKSSNCWVNGPYDEFVRSNGVELTQIDRTKFDEANLAK